MNERAALRADVDSVQLSGRDHKVVAGIGHRSFMIAGYLHRPLQDLKGQVVGMEMDRVIEIRLVTAHDRPAETVVEVFSI